MEEEEERESKVKWSKGEGRGVMKQYKNHKVTFYKCIVKVWMLRVVRGGEGCSDRKDMRRRNEGGGKKTFRCQVI